MEYPSGRWFPASASGCQFHSWDDDEFVVVYHRSSGDTHLLEPLAAIILELIESSPYTSAQLLLELQEAFQGEEKCGALEVIETTLLQLHGVGLVNNTPN